MYARKTITDVSGTLRREWQLRMGKVIQTLKYGILTGQTMEAVNSREGERPNFGAARLTGKEGGVKK